MTFEDICFPVYYVPMPINKRGMGPEMDPAKVVYTQHEVWDQNNLAIASFCDERLARTVADQLNQRFE